MQRRLFSKAVQQITCRGAFPVAALLSATPCASRSNLFNSRRFQASNEANTAAAAESAKKAESENAEKEPKFPPGYRVDPDPKGTHFQLNVLPVIYFVVFWAVVILGIKVVFFSGRKTAAPAVVEEKKEKK